MTAEEFREKILPMGDMLYRVAWHILESEADAQDAVQELYLKLWNSRDSLDGVVNLRAWCMQMLKNLCIDQVRKANVRPQKESVTDTEYMLADSAETPSGELEGRESLQRVMDAIERLPEKQRLAVRLRVLEEREYEEIVELTGLSMVNLRSLLSKARKTLREECYEINR